ncbi:MAG TPA: ParB N-terminal domain-containing protein [Mycobacteriales bacterium]|nr:ParB N-terminal domain-containing protein [Mycobacteriales bacterium]
MTDTDTNPATPEPGTPDLPRPQADPGPSQREEVPAVLVHVDPATLVIEANVRSDAGLDQALIGSIRDHGVLVPIVAWRTGDQLRVRMGQRRTLAAVQAGRKHVPVYVVDAADEGQAAQITRIVCQLIENTHRAGLPDADRVRGHQQLALLGLSAGQIARRTRTAVAAVKSSLQVAGSDVAVAAMDRHQLTVEQAAAVAEFATDSEAVEALTSTASNRPEQFPHVVQRLRDEAAEAAAGEELLRRLDATGVGVVDVGDYVFGGTIDVLDHLRPTPRAEPGTGLSAEEHASCPGHAAFVDVGSRWGSSDRLTAVYVCTDWRAHGHARRHAPAGMVDAGPDAAATPRAMSEAHKAERRRVIANNRAWDSATVVRRKWLRGFLARRSAPKDAPAWIATTLAAASREICKAMEAAHPQACDLLGMTSQERPYSYRTGSAEHPIAEAAGTATPGRATVLTLAMLLGGLEQSSDRSTWRAPTAAHRAYFTALHRWGYPLSDVERLVVDDPDPTQTTQTGETGGDTPGTGETG